MLTRCLFALLALAALVIFFSPAPGGIPESEPWLRKLLLVGIWLTGIGMAVPWGRWMPFVSPGPNLAFVSKLLGWGGASGLPYCLISEAWLAAGVCALLPVCAFALWRDRAWAAWPWYAFALGSFGMAITFAIETLPTITGPPASELSELDVRFAGLERSPPPATGLDVCFRLFVYIVPFAWILYWGVIGFVLVREVTTWRRKLHSGCAPSGSPSAS